MRGARGARTYLAWASCVGEGWMTSRGAETAFACRHQARDAEWGARGVSSSPRSTRAGSASEASSSSAKSGRSSSAAAQKGTRVPWDGSVVLGPSISGPEYRSRAQLRAIEFPKGEALRGRKASMKRREWNRRAGKLGIMAEVYARHKVLMGVRGSTWAGDKDTTPPWIALPDGQFAAPGVANNKGKKVAQKEPSLGAHGMRDPVEGGAGRVFLRRATAMPKVRYVLSDGSSWWGPGVGVGAPYDIEMIQPDPLTHSAWTGREGQTLSQESVEKAQAKMLQTLGSGRHGAAWARELARGQDDKVAEAMFKSRQVQTDFFGNVTAADKNLQSKKKVDVEEEADMEEELKSTGRTKMRKEEAQALNKVLVAMRGEVQRKVPDKYRKQEEEEQRLDALVAQGRVMTAKDQRQVKAMEERRALRARVLELRRARAEFLAKHKGFMDDPRASDGHARARTGGAEASKDGRADKARGKSALRGKGKPKVVDATTRPSSSMAAKPKKTPKN